MDTRSSYKVSNSRHYPGLLSFLIGIILCQHFSSYSQNLPPVATNDNYVNLLNQTLVVPLGTGLLSNDTDPEGGGLTVNPNPVTAPAVGTLTLNQDGSFTYIPQVGFFAPVTFEYEVCDDGTNEELVSQFDFDTATLTDATVGPDATSINTDAVQTGCGIRIPAGFTGGSVGLDVVVPNTGNIFDFTSFRIEFDYRDQENTADIVSGGNFRVYHISGNALGIRINVINGTTGLPATYTQNLGNFISGNVPYSIEYQQITGDIILIANGTTTVFPNVAPDFSPLNSALATDLIIGEFMDNAARNDPSLCSMSIIDTSSRCDQGIVSITTQTSLITNKRITYRVNLN